MTRPVPPVEYDVARAHLDEAEARVKKALTCSEARVTSKILEDKSAARGLVEEAREGGTCSLIVIGNRGLGGFGRLAMGSTSTQVIHEAHCPVVVSKTDVY